jgi:hypothetical protein
LVFNPTNGTITKALPAPLYYSGLSKVKGHTAAMVSREGGPAEWVPLGANDTIPLNIELAPRELTWFVITEATGA